MAEPRRASFAFTKLVVDDLEKMTDFYTEVFGLSVLQRVDARVGRQSASEVTLGRADQRGSESLVMLKFRNRTAPSSGEVILGFVTTHIEELILRVRGTGGRVVEEAEDVLERALRVAVVADPEGHLVELVELLG